MRQRVVAMVPEHGSFFEISTPIGVWSVDRTEQGGPAIDFVACGLNEGHIELADGLSMGGLHALKDCIDTADVLVIPTWPIHSSPIPDELLDLIRTAHSNGTCIVGLCLGAFVPAAAGLLDGRSAVTHWRHRDEFERRNPGVTFEPDTLYVDHGSVVTSAGSAAALDCCLHLVRREHGADKAAAIARSMVTAPHRSGGQSQFAAAPPIELDESPVASALAVAAGDIASIRNVADLATAAGLSRRSLERHFADRLGVTPRDWIVEQRVIAACRLLEKSDLPVDEVAALSGFGSTPSLRRELRRARDITPTAYRDMFGS